MSVQNNLVAQTQKTPFSTYIAQAAVKAQIDTVVGKGSSTFVAGIVSNVTVNPGLRECSNASILSAALLGESLHLSPSAQLAQYYMVPFNNKQKGCKEAQFVLGAAGYKQMAMRTGQYKDIDFIEVHEGEYLGRDKYTGKQRFEFIEDDDEREALPVIGYLAYFELLNGFRKAVYWTVSKMEAHADKYSSAFDLATYRKLKNDEIPKSERWKYSSYWYTDFSGMAEKTLIKHLLKKYGILSSEIIRAIENDDAVIHEDGTRDFVDNPTSGDIIDIPAQDVTKADDIAAELFN